MSSEIQNISEKTSPIFKKYGVLRAGIFGSYARGEAREDSDIDFLLEFPNGITIYDVFDLKEEVEEILNKEIDIVSTKAIVPYFRDYIYKDLQNIYE